jgi:ribosomal protein S6E (S10)
MRIKLSFILSIAIICSVAISSCKSKKGAGSANVRTLSLKTPGSYTFSFAGKTNPDAVIMIKDLSSVDKIKILSQGKEVQNVTVKFKIKITHGDTETGSAENEGTELSSQVRDLIKGAASGDKINFESMKISAPGGETVSYPPVSFLVK